MTNRGDHYTIGGVIWHQGTLGRVRFLGVFAYLFFITEILE